MVQFNKGELDVEIVGERIENDNDEDVNPNPEGKVAPKRKYSMNTICTFFF